MGSSQERHCQMCELPTYGGAKVARETKFDPHGLGKKSLGQIQGLGQGVSCSAGVRVPPMEGAGCDLKPLHETKINPTDLT